MATIKIYKKQGVKIEKTQDLKQPIFYKYKITNLKGNKILESFYCNH